MPSIRPNTIADGLLTSLGDKTFKIISENIEEIMIRTASDYDVNATRNAINRGIWAGDKKLGSIGIAVRHGVTFHGMALNVKMDLTPFSWIAPCGLQNVEVTSMENETVSLVSMLQVKESVQKHWQNVFNVAFKPVSLSDMTILMEKKDPQK